MTGYSFHGGISREVLENYLSRAVTVTGISTSPTAEDDVRMLLNIGAKFIGRVAYIWGPPDGDESSYFAHVKEFAKKLYKLDPDMVLQACVFESIDAALDGTPVPDWVFEAYDLLPEIRNFRYKDMLSADGTGVDLWAANRSVPDITRPETRLWLYYRARRYIDAGYDAIHFGQIQLIGANDPAYEHWADLLARVRSYAAEHSRKGFVICDAHVTIEKSIPLVDGHLLLDFHSFPLRPKEIVQEPQKAILEVGHGDSIYLRSAGGTTPSGWKCDNIPYLVEFDNCFRSGKEGEPGLGKPYVWGYEEVTWFAHQSHDYRNEWLRYANDWVREHDRNGHLQMPGRIPMAMPVNGQRLYQANIRSEACPNGYGQEETIREIWQSEDSE